MSWKLPPRTKQRPDQQAVIERAFRRRQTVVARKLAGVTPPYHNKPMDHRRRKLLKFLKGTGLPAAVKAGFKRTKQQFILDYGWWYEPSTEAHSGITAGIRQECITNAVDLMLEDGSFIYCEGYALSKATSMPVIHAWVTDGSGRAIDNTWEQPGVAYAGVPFKASFVIATSLKSRAIISLIDDFMNGFPLCGELGDRPEVWFNSRGKGTLRLDRNTG